MATNGDVYTLPLKRAKGKPDKNQNAIIFFLAERIAYRLSSLRLGNSL